MMKKIRFEDIQGFSKLFVDFLKRNLFFSERFNYEVDLLSKEALIEDKLKTYSNRELFVKLVNQSNFGLELSDAQKSNLELLKLDNTVVVTTGQQPGFLGGPLYVYYKTFTAIGLVEKLRKRHPNYNFVPLFWIEDNDHDCIEAFQSVLINRNWEIVNIPMLEQCKKGLHNSISELNLPQEFANFIEYFILTNHLDEEDNFFSKFLVELYKANESISGTFQRVLNYIFGKYGLLFVTASKCRQQGGFKDILFREFENFGASYSIIETANRLIELQGYHIQAKNSLPNLFYHTMDKRVKVEWDSKRKAFVLGEEIVDENNILDFFERNTARFSPNVLLRPICQDYLLPNVASVLGPSEIGYTTQLKELYEWFEIKMPAIVPRHSITFIPQNFVELLETKHFTYFLKPNEKILEEIYNSNRDSKLQKEIDNIEKEFENIFAKLKNIGTRFDKSLEISAEAHFSKSYRSFKSYINKIYSAERKKIISQHKETINLNIFILPNGTLQERMLSLAYPLLIYGLKRFEEETRKVIELDNNIHYLIAI